MVYLIVTSLLWGFSFGLIKRYLGGMDPSFVTLVRLGLSLLVFLPFLRWVPRGLVWRLLGIGVVQFGLMYLFYIRAFQYLAAYEIVLCTIFTPLFVTLLNDLQVRRFHWLFLVTAMLAVVGTGIPLYHGKSELAVDKLLIGFGLMQLSNLCFAFGQLRYQRVMVGYSQFTDRHVFGYMYVGAVVMAGLAMLVFPPVREVTLGLSREQVGVLVYLGVVASGVGFFLWNIGARRVNAGMLAIMNNAKIPIGIVVSVVVFGEKVAVGPLVVGMGILGVALFLNERYSRSK